MTSGITVAHHSLRFILIQSLTSSRTFTQTEVRKHLRTQKLEFVLGKELYTSTPTHTRTVKLKTCWSFVGVLEAAMIPPHLHIN